MLSVLGRVPWTFSVPKPVARRLKNAKGAVKSFILVLIYTMMLVLRKRGTSVLLSCGMNFLRTDSARLYTI